MIHLALVLAAIPLDRVETSIAASLSDDLTRLDLTVRARYTPVVDLDAVPIVLAAARYESPPKLTPAEVREAFPRGFSRGGLDDLKVTIDGEPCTTKAAPLGEDGEAIIRCPHRAAAGRTIEIVSRATLVIPERYGGFGKVGRAVTLAGGWFPAPARPGEPPPRGPWSLTLELPASQTAVIGERYRPSRGAVGRRTITADGTGAQIPLIVRPGSAYALEIAEGRARFLTGPASKHTRSAFLPTIAEQVRASVEDGLHLVRELGFPEPTRDRPLILVEAPLRHALVESAEGILLVSDHAFRMIEVDRFLRFHRLPLLGEVFAELARRELAADVRGRGLTSDVVGAEALERYVKRRFGGSEDAFDVLGIVSFIPSIDALLYAPDLAFAGAYFRNVPEKHPLKPDFIDFPLGFPRGHHLYEKLRDQLGGPRVHALAQSALHEGLLPAVENAWPEGAEEFLATWLGPYPRVRYQLGEIRTNVGPDGVTRAEAVIERVGDAIAEPITVRFEDDDGNERLVTAPATKDAQRTVTATLAADLDLVEIDPHRRLVETPDAQAPDPRFLHRSDPEWKVLLNNFNVLFAATEGSIETALDLGIARRNDVHWSFGVRGEYGAEAISVGARASYAFGGQVNRARLAHAVGLGAEAAYLRPGFAGATMEGAAVLGSVSYGYDDRISIWAPESGNAIRVGASYQRIFGTVAEDVTNDALSLSLRALRQWRIGARHQLSLRGAAAVYVVGRPQSQLLFPLGGRSNVRGYAQGDELGRVRGMLSGEWLHPLLTGMDLDFFKIAWVSSIDGALFGDVAVVGDDLEEAFHGPTFADVGYGLRAYIDYFGVRPGVVALDVALPLVARRGQRERGGPAVYITFSQSFVGL